MNGEKEYRQFLEVRDSIVGKPQVNFHEVFMKFIKVKEGIPNVQKKVHSLAESNGVMYWCPECGKHPVVSWNHSVSQDVSPTGGRWGMTGENEFDISFDKSVQIPDYEGSCVGHWEIKGGIVYNN